MQKIFRISFALLACVLAGCSSTLPELPPVTTPAVEPVRKASAAEIRQRCARFKALLAPLPVREIGFSHRSFDGFSPEKVCRFASDAGFNRICLFISSSAELDDRFAAFLKAAAAEKLTVDVMLRQEDFTAKHRGSSLMKSVDDRLSDLAEICRQIRLKCDLPGKTAPVDQVIVAVSPHKFVSDTRDNAGQIFAWSEKNAGPGLDNDMLMLQAFELLNKLDTCGMKLAAGVPDFYHELAVQGKVTRGRMNDFCSLRKGKTPVYLLSGGGKPSQVVSGSREEFKSVDRGQDVVLEIELAGHTSFSAGKLRRRDWRDLEKILGYVIREHQKYPAFRGIMLAPLPIFKYLIMEQD